jgi:hypothetical protein
MNVYILVKTVNEPTDNWRILSVFQDKSKAENALKICEDNNNSEYQSFCLTESSIE